MEINLREDAVQHVESLADLERRIGDVVRLDMADGRPPQLAIYIGAANEQHTFAIGLIGFEAELVTVNEKYLSCTRGILHPNMFLAGKRKETFGPKTKEIYYLADQWLWSTDNG